MLPYVRGELPVVVHADEMRQIHSAVDWAATNKYKIILAGGRDAWMLAGLLATNKVPVIYEHVFTQPVRDTEPYDVHFKAPDVLHRAGVEVLFDVGRDASFERNLPYTAAQAIAFGLPEAEALKGLTLYPAQLAGVADRLGSIEPGKEATLFVCDGNIFDLRANVMKTTRDAALATSGDYERVMVVDGRRYSHIVDPLSGYPVESFASVSVVADSCLVAGAASTLGMLLGPRDGYEWLQGLGLPFLCIDAQGRISGSLDV